MLFVGCLFDREKEKEYLEKSKSGLSNAVNTFQWNCLEGFFQNGMPATIVNVLPVGTFPKQYKDLILKSETWKALDKTHQQVGCINLPFIKQWQRSRAVKKILKSSQDKKIIIYSAYLPFLRAIHKLNGEYDITLIVTDLPEFYDLGKTNWIKRILRKWNNNRVYKYMERVDRFVLLTEQMKEPLRVGNRPYTIVEGICNQQALEFSETVSSAEKIILYTGTLHKQFGILNLLAAFSNIQDADYRLWICGGGDAENEIKEAARQDPRIQFYGYVEKSIAIELQKKATVMVNPRQNVGEYTKYSFPSKTMEYLASGKPVVAYKLDGIPNDYDTYINYVKDNSIESLTQKLIEVCEDDGEIREKALKAWEFVCTKKSARVQAKKILKLLEKK